MALGKRHYIPGYVWHITHRCHKREFLLKFQRDRHRWIEWLFQAKKRYRGFSVLNYKEVRIEDKSLLQRVKLIDALDKEDKTALIRVIDSMLTKKKILHLITQENISEPVAQR